MSRGDEIESGEPRKRGKPRSDDIEAGESRKSGWAAGDDDFDDRDEEPRQRRRLDKPQRSGLVLSVGIVEIVLGSLYLFCGVLGSATGLCFTGGMPFAEQFLAQKAKQDPGVAIAAQQFQQVQGQLQIAAWISLGEGIFNLIIGAGMLAGGIGVLRRANWARFLTLGIAAFAIFVELVAVVVKAVLIFTPGDLASGGLSVVIAIAFAGLAYPVLLLPRYAKEFAGP